MSQQGKRRDHYRVYDWLESPARRGTPPRFLKVPTARPGDRLVFNTLADLRGQAANRLLRALRRMLPTAALRQLYDSIPDSLWEVDRSGGSAWSRAADCEGSKTGLSRVTEWATRWRIDAPCVRGWALHQRYYWIAHNLQFWRHSWQGSPVAPADWRPTFESAEWPWGLLPFFAYDYLPPIFPVLKPFDEWPLNANFGDTIVSEDVEAACPLGCNPYEESEDDFVRRARRHRAARVKALLADQKSRPYRPIEPHELERHCRWLLLKRLSEPPMSSRAIERAEGVTRQAISSGIASLEHLLLFTPHQLPPGRPKRKSASSPA